MYNDENIPVAATVCWCWPCCIPFRHLYTILRMPSYHARRKKWPFIALSVSILLLFLALINIFASLERDLEAPFLFRWTDTLLLSNRTEMLGNFTIHIDWHPKERSQRFPSVQQRVKLYMGNWYLAPCRDTAMGGFIGTYQTFHNESWTLLNITNPWNPSSSDVMVIDSVIQPDVIMVLHSKTLEDCARTQAQFDQQGRLDTEIRIKSRNNMQSYCSELVDFMTTIKRLDSDSGEQDETPVLAFFGDEDAVSSNLFDIPMIAKHRAGTTAESIKLVTGSQTTGWYRSCVKGKREPLEAAHHKDIYSNRMSPILWKLELVRHWNTLPGGLRKDSPWENKTNLAYWGGDFTGNYFGTTDFERCQSNQRCRFVLQHAHSKLIDARLCHHYGILSNNTVNGVQIIRKRRGVDIVQKFKVIISFEGNDVASGLKWMLQSQSVVLMPPPTRTSWAMEELLQPWIHYIPMLQDGSNAEEMVQWVIKNDEKARKIAERATLFMYDMVYHPDAIEDDKEIRLEMAKRYRALWH